MPRFGFGLGFGGGRRFVAENVPSVFDGGSFRFYSGASASNAGDLLAAGTIPDPAFGPIVDGVRSKTGTWATSDATINGTVRGLYLRSVDGLSTAFFAVTESGGGGDIIINDDAAAIGNVITLTSLGWQTGGHEPPGLERIVAFNGNGQNFGSGWSATPRMSDPFYNEAVVDLTNPTGSGYAMEHRYYIGEDGDTGNGLTEIAAFRVPMAQVYLRQRIKWSANWDVDPTYGGMKLGYFRINGTNAFFLGTGNTTPPGTPPWPMYFENLADGGGVLYAFGSPSLVALDEWVEIECLLTAQSGVNVADGAFQMWVNGTEVITMTGKNWVPTGSSYAPNYLLQGFQWFPIRGAFGSVRRVNDSFREGEFYMAGLAA